MIAWNQLDTLLLDLDGTLLDLHYDNHFWLDHVPRRYAEPHGLDFLEAVKAMKKRVVLVTNAHGKTLAIKFRRTPLGGHFDAVVCSHDLGLPKEHTDFWNKMQQVQPFEK